jgi:hypothetical protein
MQKWRIEGRLGCLAGILPATPCKLIVGMNMVGTTIRHGSGRLFLASNISLLI